MVRRDHGEYEDVVPLPVSTREPGEGAGLLANGHSSSDKKFGTFDVEFDVEDDVLLNWQHTRPNGWLFACLPRRWQRAPECWLRLSQQQRSLLVSGSIISGVLLLCLIILAAAWHGRGHQQHPAQLLAYEPKLMAASESASCSWSDLYLPTSIKPAHYALHVTTTMQTPFTVEGQVDVQLSVAEYTPCVVLHALGMVVPSVELLVYRAGSDIHAQQPVVVRGNVRSTNKTSQQITVQFPHAVPKQPWLPVLRLLFTYPLLDGLDGFYRSDFIDAANETKVLGSTQFESIAARKAFPCFDEPSFKAVFEVKVSAPPPPVMVLSNMPLSHTHEHEHTKHLHDHPEHKDSSHGNHDGDDKSGEDGDDDHKGDHHDGDDRDGDGDDDDDNKQAQPKSSMRSKVLSKEDLITYHFHPSPPMPTYLVAWVIGELSHNEKECELDLPPTPVPGSLSGSARGLKHAGHAHDQAPASGRRNVTVRVWGTSDRVQQFGHARDVACAALQEMEHLTQVAYPLPKLDLVGIPNFAAGAMENWGLLLYKERSLLVDDSKDDLRQRYAIATTVAHETAHQWFGNLVTLDDWTELWLNEGFATYLEAVLADMYQPGMGYLTQFFADTVSSGLEADGSPASHPLSITRRIQQLSETDNWFDSVSYNKGAAIIRMMRAWMNKDNNQVTGLQSNITAATGADPGTSQHASTSQQWAPHLRRLKHGNSSSSSSSATSSHASPQSLGPPGGSWLLHSKGPKFFHKLPPASALAQGRAETPAGSQASSASQSEVVLPIDAQVPPVTASASPSTVSAGSKEGWSQLARHTWQQGSGRELGSSAAAGDGQFLAGLTEYLQSHAFGNSNSTGLWSSLAKVSGQACDQMMSTWTLRRGFPIVTVSLGEADTSSSRTVLKVEQVPFHAPRTYMVGLPFEPEMYCNDWSDDPADSSWWVPLPLRLPGVNNYEWHSFNSCSVTLKVDMPHNIKPWVLANAGRFGFYRVNYSEPLWSELTSVSKASEAHLGSIDFAGLLDDAYSLSQVRQLNITIFLQLVRALGQRSRPELPPWSIALGWLQRMTDVLSTAALLDRNGLGQSWKDCMSDLKKFVTRHVTQPFIEGVTVPGQDQPGLTFQVSASDPPELRLLRPVVLEAAGFLGYTQAMNAAVDLLAEQAAGQQGAVAPDVASAVYALAAASGSQVAYDTLVKMYEQATDAADKDRALRALARVTTRDLISQTLEYALSPAVRTQDVSVLLVRLAKQGGLGFNMTWQFVIDRADDILAKYGGGDVTYILGRRLNDLAKLFVDENLLSRLQQLAGRQPLFFSPTFFDEANEARMINHDWLRFQGKDACKWLAAALE